MTGVPGAPGGRRARRWLRIPLALAGAGAALGLLWLIFRDLDPRRLIDTILSARPEWLAALAGAVFIENLLRGWKWGQILHDRKPVSTLRLFGALMAGYAANLLAPFGVSPLVRSWLIARLENLSFATVLVTAMIARFVDGVAFAAVAVAAAATVAEYVGGLRAGLALGGAANLAVFGGLLWLLYRSGGRLDRDADRASRLLDALAARGGRRLAGLRLALREGIIWPRSALRRAGIAAASLTVKLLAAVEVQCAAQALGFAPGWSDALLVTVTGGLGLILGRLLRVPGGYSVGAAFALDAMGAPAAAALALILLRNAATIGVNLGVGVTFLALAGPGFGAVLRAANHRDPSA